jgi:hypothetical protein
MATAETKALVRKTFGLKHASEDNIEKIADAFERAALTLEGQITAEAFKKLKEAFGRG